MAQKFVSNRDVVVRSAKYGRSYKFSKGIPREDVIPQMHQDLLQAGILPVEEDGAPTKPADVVIEEPKVVVLLKPEDGEECNAKILEVMRAIVARNDSGDFTGGGMPSARAVTAALGWKVDNKDVAEVWKEHKVALLNKG